jgi:hypothetical protein
MLGNVEQLCIVRSRRGIGGDFVFANTPIAAIDIYMRVSDLRATNPKDHIYGLLGITGISITPDYSDAKLVSDVYCEYIVFFLDGTRNKTLDTEAYPLVFLSIAGIGLYNCQPGFPTWVPNLPQQAAGGMSSTRVASAGKKNQALFKEDCEHFPYVYMNTRSLFVWGVTVDTVSLVSEAPQMDTWKDGRLLQLVNEICARQASYLPGVPPLQALFRLFNRDVGFVVDKVTVIRALAFLRFLASPWTRSTSDSFHSRLQTLGFDLSSISFDEQFMQRFFPDTDMASLGFQQSLRLIMEQDLEGPIGEIWPQTQLRYIKIHDSWRYFETKENYMGISPHGTTSGDTLFILKHSNVPVVMRGVPYEHYYNLIGTSFVVGMMDGELADFVNGPNARPRWIEIR